MLVQLTPVQARVIGVLIEKEISTPDQYPLSLNALTLGCNQKSSRDPIMQLTESDVQNTLDELRDKNLLFEHQSSGSRVVKYKHRFCNTEFSDLKFSPQELAIICVLLLRGPQTPGELRTRTNRLAEFANVVEVESTLHDLTNFNGETLVVKLEREPGKRESRFSHLFVEQQSLQLASTDEQASAGHVKTQSDGHQHELQEALARIETLESQVQDLHARLQDMQDTLDILSS